MGKRGPSKKPSNLKRLQGTYRKDRDAPNAPRPTISVPNCPTWLGREAKREWKRVVKELEVVGCITQLDRSTLAAYCAAYEDWWALEGAKAEAEPTFTTESTGAVHKHPLWTQAARARDQVVKLAREFGMTPSGRTGVSAGGSAASDPDAAFLFGKPKIVR